MTGLTDLGWEKRNLARIAIVKGSTSNAVPVSARSAVLFPTESVACLIMTHEDLLQPSRTWRLWHMPYHLTIVTATSVKARLLLTLNESRLCWSCHQREALCLHLLSCGKEADCGRRRRKEET
jgi:hypothetical protein